MTFSIYLCDPQEGVTTSTLRDRLLDKLDGQVGQNWALNCRVFRYIPEPDKPTDSSSSLQVLQTSLLSRKAFLCTSNDQQESRHSIVAVPLSGIESFLQLVTASMKLLWTARSHLVIMNGAEVAVDNLSVYIGEVRQNAPNVGFKGLIVMLFDSEESGYAPSNERTSNDPAGDTTTHDRVFDVLRVPAAETLRETGTASSLDTEMSTVAAVLCKALRLRI